MKKQLLKTKGLTASTKLEKWRRRLGARLKRQRERITEVQAALDYSMTHGWRTFEAIRDVLVQAGALEEGTLKPLPLGDVARQINGTNELWLAMAMAYPAVADLPPAQLASLIAALVSADAVSRPQMSCAYGPSERVMEVVNGLGDDQLALAVLQDNHGVSLPLDIDLRLCGLVEAWTAGADWESVTGDCTLDDGDVARLLSRTSDMLRQVSHIPQLLPELRENARAAYKSMDRAPISELLR